MYELWLGLNVVFEFLRPAMLWLVLATLVWVVLVGLAARRHVWRRALPIALIAGVVGTAVAVFAIPSLFMDSSLREAQYWLDWAAVIGMGAGVGAVITAWVWPLAALASRPTRT